MKKTLLLVIFIFLMLSFAFPAESRYYGGPHSYWHHPRIFFGTSFIIPWYVPVAPPAYVVAPPVYVYPQPVVYRAPATNQAYAYPDPEFIAKYKKSETPPGEWVTVPGQWVDGTWVPPHKVQVP